MAKFQSRISIGLLAIVVLFAGCEDSLDPIAVASDRGQRDVSHEVESDQISLEGFEHHYTDNDGVQLHYVSGGEGPLVVMLHGFPDFWYTWRDQMTELKTHFRVVAMDLRGYNLSGQPTRVEDYRMSRLMEDVIAVIHACGEERATVIGHDWGGAIAWQLAIHHPEVVDQLVVCNMVHPTGSSQTSLEALRSNGNESYMDEFRKEKSNSLPVSWLCGWVKDPDAKKAYEKAFKRSNVPGMLNYYRANTKTKAQRAKWLDDPKIPELPKVQAPVLAIFGLLDKYVDKRGLNNTWEWLDSEFTLVTVPEAGHFVQQDASERVSKAMKSWLLRDEN